MKKAKRLLSVLMGLLLVVALMAGCAGSATTTTAAPADTTAAAGGDMTTAAPAEKPYIAVIAKGWQHQFWQAVRSGAEQAGEELGATISFEGPDTEAQVDRQIELIEAALAKNPAAICVAVLDKKAVIPVFEKAQSMGIPVVTFDSSADSDIPITFCATDSIGAGALAADKMAELIGGAGQVGVLANDQTSSTQIERRDGFVNQIKEKYPDIEVVDVQYVAADDLKAAEATKTMVQAYPGLKGIYSCGEGAANGSITGKEEIGKTDLVLIGFDAGKKQKEAIAAGIENGAITQDPVGMGYIAVESALKYLAGETVEKNIGTGYYYYDKDNMNEDMFKPLLYD